MFLQTTGYKKKLKPSVKINTGIINSIQILIKLVKKLRNTFRVKLVINQRLRNKKNKLKNIKY